MEYKLTRSVEWFCHALNYFKKMEISPTEMEKWVFSIVVNEGIMKAVVATVCPKKDLQKEIKAKARCDTLENSQKVWQAILDGADVWRRKTNGGEAIASHHVSLYLLHNSAPVKEILGEDLTQKLIYETFNACGQHKEEEELLEVISHNKQSLLLLDALLFEMENTKAMKWAPPGYKGCIEDNLEQVKQFLMAANEEIKEIMEDRGMLGEGQSLL